MERKEFVNSVATVVQQYIDNFAQYDKNPMIRVNPVLLTVEVENGYGFLTDLEYSNEVIEQAAAAERPSNEDATDNQARQNYDYYPVRHYFKVDSSGQGHPDENAIQTLADKYFK